MYKHIVLLGADRHGSYSRCEMRYFEVNEVQFGILMLVGRKYLLNHMIQLPVDELDCLFGLILVGNLPTFFVNSSESGIGLQHKLMELLSLYFAIDFDFCIDGDLPVSLLQLAILFYSCILIFSK